MRFQFGNFVVNDETRQLLRGGEAVHLSPKAFDLLAVLIRERPRAVPKGELHEQLWPKTFVSDASLAMLIAELRAALGDSARQPKWVRTIHRHGYAFQGEARPIADGWDSTLGHWLITSSRQIPLLHGDNIVGRDPEARVWLDEPSVSRRHAAIRVEAGRLTLEDLQSKNGTYAGDTRVTTPVVIGDGDVLRFGSVTVTIRTAAIDPTRSDPGFS